MRFEHQFGGNWTQEKLRRLAGYLQQYMTILEKYPFYKTIYVDAFAGTGERRPRKTSELSAGGTPADSPDVTQLLKGSVRVALEIARPFDSYIFIERSGRKCIELERLKSEYPTMAERMHIVKADAAEFLSTWISRTDWKRTGAVVFLDPFGMQVEWSLLELIASTGAIDLWILVPIGIGVNRLMTQEGLPEERWADRLTKFFGTDEWKDAHYSPRAQLDLFGEASETEKNTTHERLAAYFVVRLQSLFPGVADNPITLRNSMNSPMYLLCFATANPKKSVRDAALRIAQHLLKE